MDVRIFRDDNFPMAYSGGLLYFDPDYLRLHTFSDLIVFDWDLRIFAAFDIQGNTAKSLPKSPFGSFVVDNGINSDHFCQFHAEIVKKLKDQGVQEIVIVHPSAIYKGFVLPEWLEKCGYRVRYEDINQHIVLHEPGPYHHMEIRKLKKLRKQHKVLRLDHTHASKFHDFISRAREKQDLIINIDLDTLLAQLAAFPERFDIWVSQCKGEWSAAVLTTRASREIIYYYLPASSERYRSESPMVLLLDHLISHYQAQGMRIFDLGVSSIEGTPQEGLRRFKERMGAVSLPKPTLHFQL